MLPPTGNRLVAVCLSLFLPFVAKLASVFPHAASGRSASSVNPHKTDKLSARVAKLFSIASASCKSVRCSCNARTDGMALGAVAASHHLFFAIGADFYLACFAACRLHASFLLREVGVDFFFLVPLVWGQKSSRSGNGTDILSAFSLFLLFNCGVVRKNTWVPVLSMLSVAMGRTWEAGMEGGLTVVSEASDTGNQALPISRS